MYECEPPSLNTYFISLEALESRHNVGLGLFTWRAIYDEINKKIKLEFKQLQSTDKTIYCHTDLSINNDRTAIALSYFDKGKVVVSDIIVLEPTIGFKVDYESLDKFYTYLRNKFSVRFSYDQFQSEYFIQKYGGERISKHSRIWTTFQQLVEGTKEITLLDGTRKRKALIEIRCRDEIWEKLKVQILQHQIEGNKIIYFGERSPDLADAVVPSAYNCITHNANAPDEEDYSYNQLFDDEEEFEEFEFGSLI